MKKFTVVSLVLILVMSLAGFVSAQQDDSARPWIGVSISDDGGIVVNSVVADSPADSAGIQEGDRIVALNGEGVEQSQDLIDAVAELSAGDDITLTVNRDDEELEFDLTLGTFPDEDPTVNAMPRRGNDRMPGQMIPMVRLGVQYQILSEQMASNLGVASEGALVLMVQADSPAESAGLQEGDIITAVDGTVVNVDSTLGDLINGYSVDDSVSLTVLRAGEEMEMDVTLSAFQFDGRFHYDGMPNGRGFNFDGQPGFGFGGDGRMMPFMNPDNLDMLNDLFEGLDLENLQDLQNMSIVCTDDAGNEVFSFTLGNHGAGRGEMFNFDADAFSDGFDLSKLNCEVNTDAPVDVQPESEGDA